MKKGLADRHKALPQFWSVRRQSCDALSSNAQVRYSREQGGHKQVSRTSIPLSLAPGQLPSPHLTFLLLHLSSSLSLSLASHPMPLPSLPPSSASPTHVPHRTYRTVNVPHRTPTRTRRDLYNSGTAGRDEQALRKRARWERRRLGEVWCPTAAREDLKAPGISGRQSEEGDRRRKKER